MGCGFGGLTSIVLLTAWTLADRPFKGESAELRQSQSSSSSAHTQERGLNGAANVGESTETTNEILAYRLESEPRDLPWASEREQELRLALGSVPSIAVDEVRCAATLCRSKLRLLDMPDSDAQLHALIMRDPRLRTALWATRSSPDAMELTLFIGRSGFQL